MSRTGSVKLILGEDQQGHSVMMFPNDAEPIGMLFKQPIEPTLAGTTTGTTATVSITWGPDADTDPPDSDSD